MWTTAERGTAARAESVDPARNGGETVLRSSPRAGTRHIIGSSARQGRPTDMQTTQEDYRHLLADGSGDTGPAALPKSQSHWMIHRIRVQPADVGGGCVAVGTLLEWIGRAAC